MLNMNRIEELKEEVYEYEKLNEIGIEIYRENNDPDFLHKAIWFANEAHKIRRRLKEEYNIDI